LCPYGIYDILRLIPERRITRLQVVVAPPCFSVRLATRYISGAACCAPTTLRCASVNSRTPSRAVAGSHCTVVLLPCRVQVARHIPTALPAAATSGWIQCGQRRTADQTACRDR